jgi:putative membrane protein
MRYVTWTVRLVVFLFLLAFAVKNTDPVTLRFYFELAWQAPLIVLLLAFFAAGAVFGLAAALTTVFAQRRENTQLKRALAEQQAAPDAVADPLPPPSAGA